jgi:hypothetical protein
MHYGCAWVENGVSGFCTPSLLALPFLPTQAANQVEACETAKDVSTCTGTVGCTWSQEPVMQHWFSLYSTFLVGSALSLTRLLLQKMHAELTPNRQTAQEPASGLTLASALQVWQVSPS